MGRMLQTKHRQKLTDAPTGVHRDKNTEFLPRNPRGAADGGSAGVDPGLVGQTSWAIHDSHKHFGSTSVIEELEAGDHPRKQECLRLIEGMALLPIPDPVVEIVDADIQHDLMPNDPKGDALHLALASYHRCLFLLTWNCAHLANAMKQLLTGCVSYAGIRRHTGGRYHDAQHRFATGAIHRRLAHHAEGRGAAEVAPPAATRGGPRLRGCTLRRGRVFLCYDPQGR